MIKAAKMAGFALLLLTLIVPCATIIVWLFEHCYPSRADTLWIMPASYALLAYTMIVWDISDWFGEKYCKCPLIVFGLFLTAFVMWVAADSYLRGRFGFVRDAADMWASIFR